MTTAPAETAALRPQFSYLLSCNILASGSVGRYRHYVTQSWKVLPTRSKRGNLDKFAKLLADFDMVGLQEADAGSLRSGSSTRPSTWPRPPSFRTGRTSPIARLRNSPRRATPAHQAMEVLDYPLPGRIPGRGAVGAIRQRRCGTVVVVAHLSLGPSRANGSNLHRRTHQQAAPRGADGRPQLLRTRRTQGLFRQTSLVPPASKLRDVSKLAATPRHRPHPGDDEHLDRTVWTLPHLVSDHLPLAARVRLPESRNLRWYLQQRSRHDKTKE
jgi:hypothetical protein